jgi:uncharacterized protein YabE (DUF348 family)
VGCERTRYIIKVAVIVVWSFFMEIRSSIISTLPRWIVPVSMVLLSFFSIFLIANSVWAADNKIKAGERLVTVHDRGEEKSIISNKTSLREIFKEMEITTDPNDIVEPAIDEQLLGNNYQVNIYRARPVTVIDGKQRIALMSAYQTPREIIEHAGLAYHDEDIAEFTSSSDLLNVGNGVQLTIDRALPVQLNLYGNRTTVYTQAQTVAEFIKEKRIKYEKSDTLSAKLGDKIWGNMKVEIWRNGKQTVTRTESIKYGEKHIQDTDRKVGYRQVKTPGVHGKKEVTYEIVMKNGREVRRKVIQTVILQESRDAVVIVGAKPEFDGNFADALAKLRSCEGGYNSWNPAGPYYGAYQFDQGTWKSVSNAPYGKATPAEQDAAARKLYLQRGWQPWPVCGASIPDIYR